MRQLHVRFGAYQTVPWYWSVGLIRNCGQADQGVIRGVMNAIMDDPQHVWMYLQGAKEIRAISVLDVEIWPCAPPPLLLPFRSPLLRPGSAGGVNISLRIHWYIFKVCLYLVSCLPHWYFLPQTLNTAGYSSTNPDMQWDLESTPMHLCSPTVHWDCIRSREGSIDGGCMKLGRDMLWVCTDVF